MADVDGREAGGVDLNSDQDSETRPSHADNKGGLWRDLATHAGLIAIVLPLALSALRILVLAQGDPAVVIAIIKGLDVKTVVFGSILPLLPSVAIMVTMTCSLYFYTQAKFRLTLASTLLSILLLPVSSLFAVLLGGVGLLMILIMWLMDRFGKSANGADPVMVEISEIQDRLRNIDRDDQGASVELDSLVARLEVLKGQTQLALKKSREELAKWRAKRNVAEKGRDISTALLGIFILAQIVFAGPWLPVEKISDQGGEARVAIVLSEDGDSIVVLYHRTREVERLATSTLESRQICRPDVIQWPVKSIPMLFGRVPELPVC